MDKGKILIVDDDVRFNESLTKILAKKGYQAESVDSGFKALDIVKEEDFDIILLDIKMPVMDGIETYKKLKITEPKPIVIMMSAYSAEDLIKQALAEGAYGVLSKPLDIESLVAMIEKEKENGCLIMVIDDDPYTRDSFKRVLERKGYAISVAETGEESIQIVKEREHDIIFIDMKLPAMNGLETYLEIKKVNPKVTAVMMTAFREEIKDLIRQALEKGAYACIYKPFDMDEVAKMIEEIHKKKKAGEELKR